MTKYYIIAGEASGDLHGSNLIKGLKSVEPDCKIRCWGGELMQSAGGELVRHYKESAVMGFWEVLLNIRKIMGNLKRCKEDILAWQPDVVILIDYPGFNFRIAQFAHDKGFKVFYYIAPKIWAWKERRGARLQKYVDKLFIIFPFEIDYFKKRWNIDAIYRGNPLLDSVEQYRYINESAADFAARLNSNTGLAQKVDAKMFESGIALLAGSRRGEIGFLLPRMLDVMLLFEHNHFFLAAAPSIESSLYNSIIEKHLSSRGLDSSQKEALWRRLTILYGETYSIMKHCKAAIVNSGTASLEAALIGIPQVVCYGASELTYIIAKHLVKGIKYISLANLILDKLIFKELIQHNCTAEKIAEELNMLLDNAPYRAAMQQDYSKVRELLGRGGASRAVAEAIVEEVKKESK